VELYHSKVAKNNDDYNSKSSNFIKQEARKQVEKYLREDTLLEYLRYLAGFSDGIIITEK